MERIIQKKCFPCSVRASRWHCCEAVTFWEVTRYCDVIRHSGEERPIKIHFFSVSLSSECYLSTLRFYVLSMNFASIFLNIYSENN